MRILFITTSIPFPPRQGIELPNAHIIDALSQLFELDLLIITRSEQDEDLFEQRRANVPQTIKQLLKIRSHERPLRVKLFHELTLQCPMYFIGDYDSDILKRLFESVSYEAVWVSPVGGLGVLEACRQMGLARPHCVALGCNDVITTTYLDSLKEWFSGRMGFPMQQLLQGIRSIVIWPLEKDYLKRVDLLHVQTPLEKQRAHWLLGKQPQQPQVLAAQNGRKELLEQVNCSVSLSKRILYQTHLKGGRAQESVWFLRRVWPKIAKRHPDAKLLLAGTPPHPNSVIAQSLPPEAHVLGYVDDLVELYSSVSLAVVPIVHSTGLINRALDALTAGVPLVATSAVLSTVSGCQPGRDAIAADSVADFAAAVCSLLECPEQRQKFSTAGRALALKQPTWKDTTHAIIQALREVHLRSITSVGNIKW